MKITRSFSRKLNLSNYGGPSYETIDIGATYEVNLPDTELKETYNETSEELHEKAKKDVEKVVEEVKLHYQPTTSDPRVHADSEELDF